ncbi:sugar transferase [Flavobacteriaceae bacterium 3-367]|uniref:sugar transferase n=1 Tax=Eudoraea algarum TaxID=3417568 RepID=UPI0032851863
MYKSFFKRLLDVFIAIVALAVLSPIFVLVALVLIAQLKTSPFFIQKRPGKGERIFSILKFKSMNDQTGSDGKLLPDVERITKFGHFIRNNSLDEIPQLLNVLKGDMSLIGPRPLLISYLQLYSEEQKKRHLMRPGITGWAQVNGRNAISWRQKFEYDVWYVENCSFLTDLRILWLTVLKVVKKDGISSKTSATMETFTGD